MTGRPVNLLDIYPTLASLIGAEAPAGQLEGHDLSKLLKRPRARWSKPSVTTYGYKNYGIRSDCYRYIRYADGTEELYDHKKDKWEWNNLSDDPAYAKAKADLAGGIPENPQPPFE